MRRAAGAADLLDTADAPPGLVVALLEHPVGVRPVDGAAASDRRWHRWAEADASELVPIVARLDGSLIVAEATSFPLAEQLADRTGRRACCWMRCPRASAGW
jgi:hypothetical protein